MHVIHRTNDSIANRLSRLSGGQTARSNRPHSHNMHHLILSLPRIRVCNLQSYAEIIPLACQHVWQRNCAVHICIAYICIIARGTDVGLAARRRRSGNSQCACVTQPSSHGWRNGVAEQGNPRAPRRSHGAAQVLN